MSTPTALYRLYDAERSLLYVGITDDLDRRWGEHRKTQAWWPQVRHRTAEWHESREVAEAAEVITIGVERPRHNVKHNRPGHSRTRSSARANRHEPTLISAASMTDEELSSLPATIDLVEAAALIGMSRKKAYSLARQQEFPGRALPVGPRPRYRVFTLELLAAPGLVFDRRQLRALMASNSVPAKQAPRPAPERPPRRAWAEAVEGRARVEAIMAGRPRRNVPPGEPQAVVATLHAAPAALAPTVGKADQPLAPVPVHGWRHHEVARSLGLRDAEIRRLPVTIGIAEAAAIVGMDRKQARELACSGEFPCRVLAIGKNKTEYRVTAHELLTAPGLTFKVAKLRACLVTQSAA